MSDDRDEVGGGYAKYVLFVLVIVYVFNFIDRQILSILAEEIKADLGISDADIGFLYGTAFAVFYAVFGIPLGKLADVWNRGRLISIGLAFWSLMTALSGTAKNFAALAVFRFGVGIGEASATPAAFSMLSDYFPPRLRATALAIYSSGIYIGAGIGLFIGGVVVEGWRGAFPDPATAPFGIKPWQAAFFVVGLPGLVMALWVATLREPRRGMSEGIAVVREARPFAIAGREFMAVLPPLTLISVARLGGRPFAMNLAAAALIAMVAYGLIEWLGSPTQWIALGVGIYAAVSWVQSLAAKDPATFAMMFSSRAMRCICIGIPFMSFVTYGVGFWAPPFLLRVHGVDLVSAATFLGLAGALGGWIGVTLGGVLADRLKHKTANARLYIAALVPTVALPVGVWFLYTDNLWIAYGCNFVFSIASPMWIGPAASTVNDLVMPRMRAVASAFYLLMVTFIGLALGPYTIGQVSDALFNQGMASGDALRIGMLIGLGGFIVAMTFIIIAMRFLPGDEASRLDRARAVGEAV